MSSCKFPEHHGSGRPVMPVVLAVAVAWAVYHFLHIAEIAAGAVVLAAAIVLGWRFRRQLRTAAGFVALTVWFARLAWVYPHVSPATRANYWHALRAHVSWRWVCRNLSLGRPDSHVSDRAKDGKTVSRPHLLHPSVRISPDDYGIVATVRTVPGADRKAFEDQAEHFANVWGAARVSVSQPEPGRLEIRGMRRDPLLEQLGLEDGPSLEVDPSRIWLGRDEHGEDRWLDLRNVSGVVVGGQPGGGKSQAITSWETQLAPCPAVQFVNHDGKGAGEFDDLAPRAWITGGESIGELLATLETLTALMDERLATVRDFTGGKKNIWTPTEDRPFGVCPEWPLVFSNFDETQVWFDLPAAKAAGKDAEKDAIQAITLSAGLVRKARAVGLTSVFSTQKPTSDSCPSAVTSNCALSVAFSLKTLEAAKSCLGQDIGNYPSLSPVTLFLPEYAGVCVASLKDGMTPFTKLRSPLVTEDQAAEVAAATAHLRKDPRVTLPVVVPDNAAELLRS